MGETNNATDIDMTAIQDQYDLGSLCAIWNEVTNPAIARTDAEHARMNRYARAIRVRMSELGFRYGVHFKELSNGALWPIERSI